MTTAPEGGEWSAVHSGRTLPLGKTWYPLYRWLGGPQGESDRPACSQSLLLYTAVYNPRFQPEAYRRCYFQ